MGGPAGGRALTMLGVKADQGQTLRLSSSPVSGKYFLFKLPCCSQSTSRNPLSKVLRYFDSYSEDWGRCSNKITNVLK